MNVVLAPGATNALVFMVGKAKKLTQLHPTLPCFINHKCFHKVGKYVWLKPTPPHPLLSCSPSLYRQFHNKMENLFK